MNFLRWLIFLPVAFLASLLAGAAGHLMAEVFGQATWYMWLLSGAMSGLAFVWFGLRIAPRTTAVTKWTVASAMIVLGTLSAVGGFLSPPLSDSLAGLAFLAGGVAVAWYPLDELKEFSQKEGV